MKKITFFCLALLFFTVAADYAQKTEPVNIGNRRELFLDDLMVDRFEGEVRRVFHQPVPRKIVMTLDQPWEGNTCNFVTVFQDGNLYRMYYRGSAYNIKDDKLERIHPEITSYAESLDGINWVRPNLGLFEFEGSKNNNIIWMDAGSHCFTAFRDENPECPPEARYKAVGRRGRSLLGFISPDGIRWELLQDEPIITDGAFDSQNLVFWDCNIGLYRAYYRMGNPQIGRDIKMATSPDFSNWTDGIFLTHTKTPPSQFYTNVIRPYHRAPHIYLGMPGMYQGKNDKNWTPVHDQLPDLERRRLESGVSMRSGTALTDALLMWSRDGITFERSTKTFLSPGPERPGSWMYGNHWVAWHLVETESIFEGAAPELSIYSVEFYRKGPAVKLRRYTLRLDGFASIHAPIEGGEVITPPLIFDGSLLSLNFATSSSGSVHVEIQDAKGRPVRGFNLEDSVELFGDTVDRAVMWKDNPNLAALAGKPVRLRFVLKDADLYSFKFE